MKTLHLSYLAAERAAAVLSCCRSLTIDPDTLRTLFRARGERFDQLINAWRVITHANHCSHVACSDSDEHAAEWNQVRRDEDGEHDHVIAFRSESGVEFVVTQQADAGVYDVTINFNRDSHNLASDILLAAGDPVVIADALADAGRA